MGLILVNKNDIVVGKPSPWPLYDLEHNVLVDQGDMVKDDAHRDSLLTRGIYRELTWETPGNHNNDNALATGTEPEPAKTDETDAHFTFDDMKLKTESRLQLEPPARLTHDRLAVKVIGYLRDISLLVTAPTTANGTRLQLMEGENVVMRFFSGQNAFAFACTIERVCKVPYEYLHLSFPDVIQGILIRKAPRVKTRITVAVQNSNSGDAKEQVSALISNISATGVALDAKCLLGSKGDILDLAFRVQLHKIEAFMSVKGLIRSVMRGDAADPSNPGIVHHGLEFRNLQPNDMVILQSMIYQQIIENPHQLI